MTQRMTIGSKLGLTSAGLIAALAVVGVVAIYNLAGLNRITQVIITDPMPGMDKMASARTSMLAIDGAVWQHFSSPAAMDKARIEQQIEEQKTLLLETFRNYEPTITTEQDRALFDKLKPAVQRVFESLPAVLALSRSSQSEQARSRYVTETQPIVNEAKQLLQAEVELNRSNGEKYAAESQKTYTGTIWLLIFTIAACAAGGAGLAYLVIRRLNRDLRRAVTELSLGADQVASAASQIASSSQSLAQGSNEQAAALQQTSASSEEINSMARQNTDTSRGAAQLVRQSQQKFVATNQSLEHTVAAIGEIHAQSGKISKIIKVIDEIAFQTNILALNAAVEAARAGEAGMGFAVVADEVRNLAQRCAQAARDTTVMIEESVARSNDGKNRVDQVATEIRIITDESARVQSFVEQVSAGSQEQARGIEQIARAIAQMEEVTQRTAASAEESAAASEELSAQSSMLRDIVNSLTGLVGSDR